jgi:predicted nucleic acid-binding protein
VNVVDSSGWLEYVADGPNAGFFAKAIESTRELIVPTLSIYEVFKRILQQRGEGEALQVVAAMHQGTVVDLSSTVALRAARLAIDLKLPLADSVMLATARAFEATFWTQDADFKTIAGVRYAARKNRD